ncbi:MAG: PIN domain-containing protein [Halochromatium sp.]|nr:PIN domain-containing protein [Halochromatium sp.]
MNLIDTCGWIEWLTDGVLRENFAPYFVHAERLITPTSVQFELYKWVSRHQNTEAALSCVALTEQTLVVPLTTSIALLASDLSIAHKLSFADAIIYATASYHQATLITSDDHFLGLPDVVYFQKR